MISKKVNLNTIKNKPLFISTDKEIELSLKEAEAIAEGIIYYFKINSKN